MPPRHLIHRIILGLGLGLLAGRVSGADQPKHTIAEVMKAIHKGDAALGKKISKGEGTKEDFAKLVEYYTALPLNEPPEGSAASWKEKSTALLEAAKALKEGKEGALAQYNKAVNCKACHSVHRGS